MEKYEKPEMEIVDVNNDVILTSGCGFIPEEDEIPCMGLSVFN